MLAVEARFALPDLSAGKSTTWGSWLGTGATCRRFLVGGQSLVPAAVFGSRSTP